jgi:hypothetical protein
MLNNLSSEIAECYRHAEDCARRAQSERDPGLRQDFLDMERRWLALARSYELTERATSSQTAWPAFNIRPREASSRPCDRTL